MRQLMHAEFARDLIELAYLKPQKLLHEALQDARMPQNHLTFAKAKEQKAVFYGCKLREKIRIIEANRTENSDFMRRTLKILYAFELNLMGARKPLAPILFERDLCGNPPATHVRLHERALLNECSEVIPNRR